jgi:hemerythrin
MASSKAEVSKIQWEDKFSVDVPELDEFQKTLFDKFNALIDMEKQELDAKTVTNMVSEINDCSKMFFSTEEKILKRQKYPDLESHSRAHRQFIKHAIALRREMAEDVSSHSIDAVLELRDWLVEHIETRDVLYVPFLRINRYINSTKKKN